MDITIIGAGGSVGSELARMIVSQRLLDCDQRLALVGNPAGESARSLLGLAADLADAYAETAPPIEVILDSAEIRGDLIIVAGGATLPTDQAQGDISRDRLARANLPLFRAYAQALAEHGHGHEIVMAVSNPNELAVDTFSRALGRERVIGMGAFLDSWRFRAEIAQDLGVRRQSVHAFMVGEHGVNMVPLWSGVHVYGMQGAELQDALSHIRRGHVTENLEEDVAEALRQVRGLIGEAKIHQAYALVSTYPPDIRVVLKPFVTHFSGAKTVTSTAQATLEMIRHITLGSDALVSGQITLRGEYQGIHSTIGVPFVIGNQGVDRIIEVAMNDVERALLARYAMAVQAKIEEANKAI